MTDTFTREITHGNRFTFGKNWASFLNTLNDERISEAQLSLQQMLGGETLIGKRFLDIGCGSGLFSLVARKLGAEVYSFDFDPQSVACTAELKRRYFPSESDWIVESGSALDKPYLDSLGRFDIVYSWGVLHHTGAMWQALNNVSTLVDPGGKLFISIYNDQRWMSSIWRRVKRIYNQLPTLLKAPYIMCIAIAFEFKSGVFNLVTLRPQRSIQNWTQYYHQRGMSRWHDYVDWAGGYPFEVATPDAIFDFYTNKGFILRKLITCGGGHGCNQYVFERSLGNQ